jgi:hypothetical protein
LKALIFIFYFQKIMDQCPLLDAGYVVEDSSYEFIALTEKGVRALADDVLKVNLLQIAGTCTMPDCNCEYRKMMQKEQIIDGTFKGEI